LFVTVAGELGACGYHLEISEDKLVQTKRNQDCSILYCEHLILV